uniref:Uncharacterized protein n=1 Tax=Arundo donax TaxID=35708 RepID=A0A0A9F987_ARUDO
MITLKYRLTISVVDLLHILLLLDLKFSNVSRACQFKMHRSF